MLQTNCALGAVNYKGHPDRSLHSSIKLPLKGFCCQLLVKQIATMNWMYALIPFLWAHDTVHMAIRLTVTMSFIIHVLSVKFSSFVHSTETWQLYVCATVCHCSGRRIESVCLFVCVCACVRQSVRENMCAQTAWLTFQHKVIPWN